MLFPHAGKCHDQDEKKNKRIENIRKLNDAALKLHIFDGTEWVNVHLAYGYFSVKGVDVLLKEGKAKTVIDPGMTGGLIESCHFDNDKNGIEKELLGLLKAIPEGLPTNFSMSISPFLNVCFDDSKYTLKIIRSTGVQRFIYSQTKQCMGEVPIWLQNIVNALDTEFQKYKDCAWEPNKYKNDNANDVGTDAQKDARPF